MLQNYMDLPSKSLDLLYGMCSSSRFVDWVEYNGNSGVQRELRNKRVLPGAEMCHPMLFFGYL